MRSCDIVHTAWERDASYDEKKSDLMRLCGDRLRNNETISRTGNIMSYFVDLGLDRLRPRRQRVRSCDIVHTAWVKDARKDEKISDLVRLCGDRLRNNELISRTGIIMSDCVEIGLDRLRTRRQRVRSCDIVHSAWERDSIYDEKKSDIM